MPEPVVLNEMVLTAEQSASLRTDIILIQSLHSAERRAKYLMVVVRVFLVVGLILTGAFMVTGVLAELPAGAIAVVGLFTTPVLDRFAEIAAKERDAQRRQVKSAPYIHDFYSSYVGGETATKKMSNYLALLTHQKVRIGSARTYTLQLDATSVSEYIVRVFSHAS